MAVTAKKLFSPAQLGNTAGTYYSVPTNTRTLIKKLTFTNNDASARTVTVYLVPSGGSAGASNLITKSQSIAAGAVYECFEAEGHILSSGDTLQALADVAAMVTIQASGVEYV